jgi:hypothetical protein
MKKGGSKKKGGGVDTSATVTPDEDSTFEALEKSNMEQDAKKPAHATSVLGANNGRSMRSDLMETLLRPKTAESASFIPTESVTPVITRSNVITPANTDGRPRDVGQDMVNTVAAIFEVRIQEVFFYWFHY